MCIHFSLPCVCMRASWAIVLLFVGASDTYDPYQRTFDVLHLNGFSLPAYPEDLHRFWLLGRPHSHAAVLLLNTACVIHHVLSWAVRSGHDKYCVSVYETIMLASHFKQALSSTVECTALSKSVLWAHGVIIQRQEDVSFAESMKYNIFHYLLVKRKSWENKRKDISVINE